MPPAGPAGPAGPALGTVNQSRAAWKSWNLSDIPPDKHLIGGLALRSLYVLRRETGRSPPKASRRWQNGSSELRSGWLWAQRL